MWNWTNVWRLYLYSQHIEVSGVIRVNLSLCISRQYCNTDVVRIHSVHTKITMLQNKSILYTILVLLLLVKVHSNVQSCQILTYYNFVW